MTTFTEIIEQTNGQVIILNGHSDEIHDTAFELDAQTRCLLQPARIHITMPVTDRAFVLQFKTGNRLLVFDTTNNSQLE